jgi:hypothetical protein
MLNQNRIIFFEKHYNMNLLSFNRLGIKKEQPVGAKVLIKEVKG